MGYRVFKDSHGTEWQTWDVVPKLGERRLLDRRRISAAPPVGERRRLTERRIRISRRPVLDGLYAGWLCFEASVEKRRLTPIPMDWQSCGVDRLEEYCRQATPAGRPSISA